MSQPAPGSIKIAAISVYVPPLIVFQKEVTEYCQMPLDKAQRGLGQLEMAITMDSEDSVSLARNALQMLLDSEDIQEILRNVTIGRLEVGTETSVDRSKSIKSYLVDMLDTKYTSGADTINACLGGVIALENAVSWLKSHETNADTQKPHAAIVVTTDIARYTDLAALPTGGAGAVAMLLTRACTRGIECDFTLSSYWENATDFYKPHIASPAPTVNGAASIECYLRAGLMLATRSSRSRQAFLNARYTCFHTPYCALPRKLHAILYRTLRIPIDKQEKLCATIKNDAGQSSGSSNISSGISLASLSKTYSSEPDVVADYEHRCAPSLQLSARVGNIYTGSIFLSLTAILEHISATPSMQPSENTYSIYASGYGSGLGAVAFQLHVSPKTMPYIIRPKRTTADPTRNLLRKSIESNMRLLQHMLRRDPLVSRLLSDHCQQVISPGEDSYITCDREHIPPGTWFLSCIDCNLMRIYQRK